MYYHYLLPAEVLVYCGKLILHLLYRVVLADHTVSIPLCRSIVFDKRTQISIEQACRCMLFCRVYIFAGLPLSICFHVACCTVRNELVRDKSMI